MRCLAWAYEHFRTQIIRRAWIVNKARIPPLLYTIYTFYTRLKTRFLAEQVDPGVDWDVDVGIGSEVVFGVDTAVDWAPTIQASQRPTQASNQSPNNQDSNWRTIWSRSRLACRLCSARGCGGVDGGEVTPI